MTRRRFLGWLAAGAALTIALPTSAWNVRVQTGALEYLRLWVNRAGFDRMSDDIVVSGALFEAVEAELHATARFSSPVHPLPNLWFKGHVMRPREEWRGWRVAFAEVTA